MKICAIIPTFNHYKVIRKIVEHLRQHGLQIYIVDDGSTEPARSIVASLQKESSGVTVLRLERNRGKGAAVIEGFLCAMEAGFTHAVQIDADGQHDINAVSQMLEAAKANPDALISGQPVYDGSIPKSRKIGRWITHIWVWIETLSFRISDSMCGFRVYPLASVQKLLAQDKIGSHMEFDTEIMVRLFWLGVPPIMLPVKVTYPPENISNFDLWLDNWRISKTHALLFLTMLLRLPEIIRHRPLNAIPSTHWSDMGERGIYWGLKFCAGAYYLLGREGCKIVIAPIVLYFYLTGAKQRLASHQFLTQALKRPATFKDSFRQYMNFAMRALDVFIAWTGGVRADTVVSTNPAEFAKIVSDRRGGLFIVAHLGNVDIARAVLDKQTRQRLTILLHTRHAENYNRVLQKVYPDAGLNLFQVTEIGPETIVDLKQRVENGEWIVIAGDRTSVLSKERSVSVPFLGKNAAFPQGPWILGALLECPVYLLFCLRNGKQYNLSMENFADRISLPRDTREEAIRACALRYAKRLEHYCSLAPFQWYNFYDFWAQ